MPAKFMISVALVLSIVQAQQCISLASSQQCADYKSFSILSFPGVANAGDFDKYVQSQAAFNFPQCSSWSNVASTPIRYSATFVCGWAVYYSTQLASGTKCNTGGGSVPTPICQASAAAALADVKSNLDKNCPSVQIYSQYNQFVYQINNTNCMLGIGKDQSMKCGFSSASESSDYCSKNANALCCTSTNNLVGSAPSNPTPSSSAAAPGSSTSATPSIDPSAPVNATTSLPNTAPPGNAVSPLLIGAAALGVALVAVLGAVLYFMTKKGKGEDAEAEFHGSVADDMKRGSVMPNTMSMSNANNAPVETMECIFEYKANLFDELTLEVGDEVEVLNKFDDGWALGHNLTSGKEGTFPLACLAPFGASSEYRDSRFESQYSKRDSSIRYTVDSSTFNKPY